MKTLTIKPFSVNRSYTGVVRKSKEYRAFEKHMLLILPAKQDIPDKMHIVLQFGFNTHASDADNPIKTFVDVLQKKYKFNDNRVYKIEAEKVVGKGLFIKYEIKPYLK